MWPTDHRPAASDKPSVGAANGRTAAATATPSTATPSNAPSSLPDGIGTRMLVAPANFDGAPLTTSNSIGNSLSDANAKIAAAGQTPLTAIYGPNSGMPKYVSYGLYGGLALPSVQLDAAFNSASAGATISQTTDENAGPLGGAMRCAVMTPSTNTAIQIPICAWADNSTMDILMQMPNANGTTTVDLPGLAEKARELRVQMEVAK